MYIAQLLIIVSIYFSCKNDGVVKKDDSMYSIKVETAHLNIWSRYVNQYNILNDFTGLDGEVSLPTPEECHDGKINALGWWTPIENGAFFNGIYMDGLIKRWKHTKSEDDLQKIKRIASGLIYLSSISKTPGFVARGVARDGFSHYAMSSNDQVGGWFYGLWLYLKSGLASESERRIIETKMQEVVREIVRLKYFVPAEPPFLTRGSLGWFDHNSARLLFMFKALYSLTSDKYWSDLYSKSLSEKGGFSKKTRLEIIEDGIITDKQNINSTWDKSPSIGCLRELWELEQDTLIRNSYKKGLTISAVNVMKNIGKAYLWNPNDSTKLELDWRKLNMFWVPQKTDKEAEELAEKQLRILYKTVQRRVFEDVNLRDPIFSAWVITQSPDVQMLKEKRKDLLKLIDYYDYSNIYHVWFFPVESIWWTLN